MYYIYLVGKTLYMNYKGVIQLTLVIICTIFCGSCANKKGISTFSNEGVSGLKKFEEIQYGFTRNCEEACLDKNIREFNVSPGPCNCSADQKADSINRIIYSAALGYFQGLAMLADNEKTHLNTSGLTGILSAGDFGPVTLKTEQVDAFSRITATLMKVATNKYRVKNLRKYIIQAAGSLPVLLEFLHLNLAGNLSQKLEVRKMRLKDFYFDYSRDPELSAYERTKFVEDYYKQLGELSAEQEQIQLFSDIIILLMEGHTELTRQIENPRESVPPEELLRLVSKLHGKIMEFNSAAIWEN